MSPENAVEILDRYVNRRPYRPFTLIMNDGSTCEIDNPNAIGYRVNSPIYFVAPGGRIMWFDHESILKVFDGMTSELAS